MNNILNPARMQRLVEAGARRGDDAYTLGEMMTDLRRAVWTELRDGDNVDAFRRNLQRGYLERMAWLMTEEPDQPSGQFAASNITPVDVSQSDIRAFVRGELETVKTEIGAALNANLDRATTYHLRDALVRIDDILDSGD